MLWFLIIFMSMHTCQIKGRTKKLWICVVSYTDHDVIGQDFKKLDDRDLKDLIPSFYNEEGSENMGAVMGMYLLISYYMINCFSKCYTQQQGINVNKCPSPWKGKHNGGCVFSRPIYYPIYTPPLHSAKARNRNFLFQHQLQWKQQSL